MSAVAAAAGALLFGAATTDAVPQPADSEMQLSLLHDASSASFYAVDEFRCRGFSYRSARRLADRSLGQDFLPRLSSATAQLKMVVGAETAEEATTILPLGYKVTLKYCRKTRGTIDRARRALSELERSLGTR